MLQSSDASYPDPAVTRPPSEGDRLHIALLGGPQVGWAGQTLVLPRRQTRALLYRLAAAPRPVPRDHLGFLFWPDAPDATARRGLVVLLNHLRRALPDPTLLISDGDAVGLDSQRVRVDTLIAVAAIAAAERTRRLDRLAAALASYRGPFLDGFTLADSPEFEQWRDEERTDWERQAQRGLTTLVTGYTTLGDYPAAIAAAHRALAIEATDETMHRRLIALYAAAGDRAAALRQFEQCTVILEDQVGLPPAAATRALQVAVRDGRPLPPECAAPPTGVAWHSAPPVAEPPAAGHALPGHALPIPPTPLLGRSAELAAARERLTAPTGRLVTLTGPGGSGKTRLALALAWALRGHFADAVAFVALAPLRHPALIVTAIAGAYGLQESGGVTLAAVLRDYLSERPSLLVLDNCEHLATAAPVVAELLGGAPQLRVLATSRGRLNLAGEQVVPVPPLPLPMLDEAGDLVALAQQPALALLVERARAVNPTFALTSANAADLVAICTRLDGLPLALELAAARLKLLTPAALLARLDRPLALLAGGPRDHPVRQQTLRATLDWSYQLLSADEQRLFAWLGCCAGSFTLPAAEALGAAPLAVSGVSILDGVQALLEANLVQRVSEVTDEPRVRLLETVRDYALERLAEQGAAMAASQAHRAYYLALAEGAARAPGAELADWFRRLDRDQANLLAAIDQALASHDGPFALRLTAALGRYWLARGHLAQGRHQLERALASAAADDVGRAAAAEWVCQLAIVQGDYASALDQARVAVAGRRQHDQPRALCLALLILGGVAGLAGDYATAAAAWTEGVSLAEAATDPAGLALVAWGRGRDARHTTNSAAARGWLEAALAHARRHDDPLMLTHLLLDLATVTLALGDALAARAQASEALTLARTLGLQAATALALNELGEIARYQGDYPTAAQCYTESLHLWQMMGNRSDVPRLLHNLAYVALHEGAVAQAATLLHQSLDQFTALGIARGVAEGLTGLAAVAAVGGHARLAAHLWGAAEAQRQAGNLAWGESETLTTTGGWAMWPPDRVAYARYLAPARAALPAPEFVAAWAAGRALTPEAVRALAATAVASVTTGASV